MGRIDAEPQTQDNITFKVPRMVYQLLSEPRRKMLGNHRAKRLVHVVSSPQKLIPPLNTEVDLSDKLLLEIRIRQSNRYVEDNYVFTLNPNGTMFHLRTSQFGGHAEIH